MKNVDTKGVDVQAWKASAYSAGSAPPSRKVQLGGQILKAESEPAGALILAEQLPIVEHPKYGPAQPQDRGMGQAKSLFALSFHQKLGDTWVQPGNYFIVIGRIDGLRAVMIEGGRRPEPYLIAQCIHLWKNQGRPIASFPFETGAGYYPLPEETFCIDDSTDGPPQHTVERETPAPH